MAPLLGVVEEVLHARPEVSLAPRPLLGLGLVASVLYGAVLGGHDLRPLQMLYSALKLPLLLGGSALICLPPFLVLNTALGLREDFSRVLGALLRAQAVAALTLLSLAPITLLVYVSTDLYAAATLFNGVVFLVATLAAQSLLRRSYAPLIARRPRHRLGLHGWLALTIFVTIQLSWVLRPFLGAPGMPIRFLREGMWDNAYVVVARTLWEFVGR